MLLFLGHRGARIPGSRNPGRSRFGYSLLTKSKGRQVSGGEMRNEFVSLRPPAGSLGTSVSKIVFKVPKILPHLYKENVEQRWLGTC